MLSSVEQLAKRALGSTPRQTGTLNIYIYTYIYDGFRDLSPTTTRLMLRLQDSCSFSCSCNAKYVGFNFVGSSRCSASSISRLSSCGGILLLPVCINQRFSEWKSRRHSMGMQATPANAVPSLKPQKSGKLVKRLLLVFEVNPF